MPLSRDQLLQTLLETARAAHLKDQDIQKNYGVHGHHLNQRIVPWELRKSEANVESPTWRDVLEALGTSADQLSLTSESPDPKNSA